MQTVIGTSRSEKKTAPNGEELQTKYFGHISCHISLEKDIVLGTMPGLRRQGDQRKEWSDDFVEWTSKTVPDLVWMADDRLAYQRFVYEVAHTRELSTAPWLIDSWWGMTWPACCRNGWYHDCNMVLSVSDIVQHTNISLNSYLIVVCSHLRFWEVSAWWRPQQLTVKYHCAEQAADYVNDNNLQHW